MGVGDPKVSSWPKKKYETWQAFNQSLSMKTGSEEEDLRQIVDANDPLQNKRKEKNIPATSAFYNIPQLEPLRPTQCLDIFSRLGSANPPPSKPADQGAQPPSSKRRRVRKQDGSEPNQGSKYAPITIDDKEAALYSSGDESEEPDTPVPEPKPAPPVSDSSKGASTGAAETTGTSGAPESAVAEGTCTEAINADTDTVNTDSETTNAGTSNGTGASSDSDTVCCPAAQPGKQAERIFAGSARVKSQAAILIRGTKNKLAFSRFESRRRI
ncbi:hypothetical protein FB645_004593 [Coemansia sp. IMI 203386]|nr:hypothetical protein FB645_004593 [Coemansia sp. IMI 203386]